MKNYILALLLWITCITVLIGQVDIQKPFKKSGKLKLPKIEPSQKLADNLLKKFERKNPVSTTFDDAIYEAEILRDFEPDIDDYKPLSVQHKSKDVGFKLTSGLYTMDVKSFCLRGYTYSPSQGDGHLYAPLRGRKSGFVQEILERYGEKPNIPQQDIQVLLWAIIAGSDMNTLGVQYAKTLHELFNQEELLKYKGKEWLEGVADEQIAEFKQSTLNIISPKLQAFIDADHKIRVMVQQNRSFREIEKIAIIAGIAPHEDMIREVSKGRWSYHPSGFFVRFFPSGYSQTRIDVFVPFEGVVQVDRKGNAIGLNNNSIQGKEVWFNPSSMVASPANQSSQRVGMSSVPVDDLDCWDAATSIVGLNSSIENPSEAVDCSKSKIEWITDDELELCSPFQGNKYFSIELGNTYDVNSKNYHCYYVENIICDKSSCSNCTEENVYKLLLQNVQYAAPTDESKIINNCGVTNVSIPCNNYNPIITTLHPLDNSIINYTVSYWEWKTWHQDLNETTYPLKRSHFLHPGKVQRTIFSEGSKIKIATMGEGSGSMPENNLIYAKRTWGAVDNRLKNAFHCQ